jgi:hypothetical protein
MGTKRTIGIICQVIGALLLLVGLSTVSQGLGSADSSDAGAGYAVGYAIGALLPGIAVVGVCFWLCRKSK